MSNSDAGKACLERVADFVARVEFNAKDAKDTRRKVVSKDRES